MYVLLQSVQHSIVNDKKYRHEIFIVHTHTHTNYKKQEIKKFLKMKKYDNKYRKTTMSSPAYSFHSHFVKRFIFKVPKGGVLAKN